MRFCFFESGGLGLAAFVPSSVIKGLLAAIGVILILKQLPHLLVRIEIRKVRCLFLSPTMRTHSASYLLSQQTIIGSGGWLRTFASIYFDLGSP